MAGLSTANAAHGFMQGFGFMENVKDRRLQRDRQVKADARAEEELAHQRQRQGLADARQTERYNRELAEYNLKQLGRVASIIEYGGNPDTPEMAALLSLPETMKGLREGQLPLESPEVAQAVQATSPDLISGSEVADELGGVAFLTRGKQPGTVVIGMRRNGEIVPKTDRQSTAQEDPVHQYQVDPLMKRGMGWAGQIDILKNNPKERRALLKALGMLKDPEPNKNATELEKLLIARAKAEPGSDEHQSLSARIQYLEDPRKPSGPEKPIIKTVKGEDGFSETLVRVDPKTNQLIPLEAPLSKAELMPKAEAYAKTRIDETAGYFSSDGTDFKPWGGSRERARQYFIQEYLNLYGAEQGGGQQMASGGNPDIRTVPGYPTPTERQVQGLYQQPNQASLFLSKFGYLPEGFEIPDETQVVDLPEVPRPGV
ncbi:hypothetical protein [Microbulbifer discodermiae]|uniref:hypothetical protein n=1 Tax=Microbulbifer sp. 2201CG32-9 TaxID=3232309 RepID=UPI00345BC98E